MKRLLFLFCLTILSFSSYCQHTYEKIWADTFGLWIQDAVATADGGMILSGLGDESRGNVAMIHKVDCRSQIEWTRTFLPGSTIGNVESPVIKMSNGDYVHAANVGAWPNYNALITRLDENGELIWQRYFNTSGNEQIKDVLETENGNLMLFGGVTGFDSGSQDNIYVVEMSGTGDLLWSRIYSTDFSEYVNRAVRTQDGGYAATGRLFSGDQFGLFLLKLDANGETEYLRMYGDTNKMERSFGLDLHEMKNGDLLLLGGTGAGSADDIDGLVLRVNSQGDVLWKRAIEPLLTDRNDWVEDAYEEANGDLVLAIQTSSFPGSVNFTPGKHWMIRLRGEQDLLYSKTYTGGATNPNSTHLEKIANYNGYYAISPVGGIDIPDGLENQTGPMFWRLDSALNGACNPVDRINQTLLYDPPLDEVEMPVMEIGSGMNAVSLTEIDDFFELPKGIHAICEEVDGRCDGLPTGLNAIAKKERSLVVSPNPASDYISLDFTSSINGSVRLHIFTSNGTIIENSLIELSEGTNSVNKDVSLVPGLYFLEIETDEAVYSTKFVIQ